VNAARSIGARVPAAGNRKLHAVNRGSRPVR
jgi:hypothetical protein